MDVPCLVCFQLAKNHERGVCPGRPKDAREYAERQLRQRAPQVWTAKVVAAEILNLISGLRK